MSKKVTKEEVEKVANLSRLNLGEGEAISYAKELSVILGHVEQLSEVDTEGVEPTFHAVKNDKPLREDVVVESLSNEVALQNAPEKSDGCFKVPKVIE